MGPIFLIFLFLILLKQACLFVNFVVSVLKLSSGVLHHVWALESTGI